MIRIETVNDPGKFETDNDPSLHDLQKQMGGIIFELCLRWEPLKICYSHTNPN